MVTLDKKHLIGDLKSVEVEDDPRIVAVDEPISTRVYWTDTNGKEREFVTRQAGPTTDVYEVDFDTFYQVEILSPVPLIINTEANNADVNLATNWVSIQTLTTPTAVDAGFYENYQQCLWSISAVNRSAAFRTIIDGIALPALLTEAKDTTNDNVSALKILPRELGLPGWDVDNIHTIELQGLIEQGGGATPTLTMTDCFSQLERKK